MIERKTQYLFKVFFSLLLILSFVPKQVVEAVGEGQYGIEVIRDIGKYSSIGQFNEDGVAVVSVNSQGYEEKYGLIDYVGNVLLEPVHTYIDILDDHWFAVNNRYGEGNDSYSANGIYSSSTKSFLIEPEYEYIPANIRDLKIIRLSKHNVNNRDFLFSHKGETFSPILMPSSVVVKEGTWFSYRKLNPDIMLFASGTNDDDRVWWLSDIYGNRIEDRTINYADGYYVDGTSYVSVSENPESANILYKVIKTDGVLSLHALNSDRPNDYFSTFSREGYAIYSGNNGEYKLYPNSGEIEYMDDQDYGYPGLEVVQENDKFGIKNSNNEFVVNPIYNNIQYSNIFNGYILNKNEIIFAQDNIHFAEVYKTGYYFPQTNETIEALYSDFTYSLVQKGYTLVEKYDGTATYTNTAGPFGNEEATWSNKTFGLIDADFNWIITPDHGYVDIERKSNDDFAFYFSTSWKVGLVNVDPNVSQKKITDAVYDLFFLGSPEYAGGGLRDSSPEFDADGFVKVGVYDDSSNLKVGLASRTKLEVDALYKDAYYKNGYFYLKNFDGSWDVQKRDNPNEQVHVLPIESKNIDKIELVGPNMEYIIVENKIDNEIDSYYEVGVLNRSDMSVYLDFEYRYVLYDDQKWIVAKYIEPSVFTAVYNLSLEEIVPLSPKYGLISTYSEGYAIALGADNELFLSNQEQETSLFSKFFLQANAVASAPVVDVIDKDGNVVLSLGNDYLEATIIGEYEGNIKLLLLDRSGFKIANFIVPDETSPVVNGIVDGNVYTSSVTITFNEGTATLNGNSFTSGTTVSTSGKYVLIVEDSAKNKTTVNFELLIPIPDTTAPIVSGVVNNTVYNSSVVVVFNEGTATLNGNSFASGTTVSTSGKYVLIVEDAAKNKTTVNFELKIENSEKPVEPIASVKQDNSDNQKKTDKVTEQQKSTPTFEDNLNTLTSALNDVQELSDKQFIQVVRELLNGDADFVNGLSNEEQETLNQKIQEIFKDKLKITIEGNSQLKLEGHALIADLNRLLDGDKVDIRLEAKEELNSIDQSLISSYINKNNLDSNKIYSIDINLFQSINGDENKLTLLTRPVTITLPIPTIFKDVKDFKVVHIHEGTVYELDVVINNDGTFTFTTDKFSSFTLLDATKIIPIIEEEKTSNNNPYLLIGGLVLISGLFIIFLNRKKLLN